MAHVERVPVTRLVTISGYARGWELDNIIRDLSEDISDEWRDGRGKIKITIEYTED